MIMTKALGYSIKNSHHPMSAVVGLGLVAMTSLLAHNGERSGDRDRRLIQKRVHASE